MPADPRTPIGWEERAAKYATAQGFQRKGDGRESFDTLMRYEIRDYIEDAHLAGVREGMRVSAEIVETRDCNCAWPCQCPVAGAAIRAAMPAQEGK